MRRSTVPVATGIRRATRSAPCTPRVGHPAPTNDQRAVADSPFDARPATASVRTMRRLRCSEVWGGTRNEDVDVCSPGLNVSLHSSACGGGKGGDVYFLSLCSQERVTRIAIADVAGHGAAISRVGQWVYQEMASRLDEADLPGMMAALNRRVMQADDPTMTTALVVSYYRDIGRVYYCYAGHPPILRRARGGGWDELRLPAGRGGENLPFGVNERAAYTMGDAAVAEGDVLLLYSDGVLEAPDGAGAQFGIEGLQQTLAGLGGADPIELKRRVIGRLKAWTGDGLDHDDVTLLAAEVTGRGGRRAARNPHLTGVTS